MKILDFILIYILFIPMSYSLSSSHLLKTFYAKNGRFSCLDLEHCRIPNLQFIDKLEREVLDNTFSYLEIYQMYFNKYKLMEDRVRQDLKKISQVEIKRKKKSEFENILFKFIEFLDDVKISKIQKKLKKKGLYLNKMDEKSFLDFYKENVFLKLFVHRLSSYKTNVEYHNLLKNDKIKNIFKRYIFQGEIAPDFSNTKKTLEYSFNFSNFISYEKCLFVIGKGLSLFKLTSIKNHKSFFYDRDFDLLKSLLFVPSGKNRGFKVVCEKVKKVEFVKTFYLKDKNILVLNYFQDKKRSWNWNPRKGNLGYHLDIRIKMDDSLTIMNEIQSHF